jgi:hypothetical protein
MAIILVGLGCAGFLYAFLHPTAIKAAMEINYRKMKLGQQPIQEGFPVWFWRMLAATGVVICGFVLVQVLWKSN